MEDLKGAIQLLLDTGAEGEKLKWEEINGRYYTTQDVTEFAQKPMADPITASTLDAMIDYIEGCDAEFGKDMIIHIESPTRVTFKSQLNSERKREGLFVSEAYAIRHNFDSWMDQDEFVIHLASSFDATEDKELLLKYAGTIEAKTVATYGDDGISQKATISTGIASKAPVILPSTVNLAPYRTFPEIKQTTSPFIFRISDGEKPKFKLVLADGGRWKLQAMRDIAEYIVKALKDRGINRFTILR